MALLDIDTWITEFEAAERLSRDLQAQLVYRNSRDKLSVEYAKLSATIRIRLKQLSSELDQLDKKLEQNSITGKMTVGESKRRKFQLETLQSKLVGLETQFRTVDGSSSRSQLLQGGSSLWDDDDDDVPMIDSDRKTDPQSVQSLRQEQIRILDDQNQGLESLSKIISRQKDLAIKIGDEVDLQNDIIDDLAVDMERTDIRINSETRHVGVVTRKDTTWGYWLTIIFLFIAIIIVSFL
ncbi:Syntaxin-8 [Pseudolycoriella hygida]|uniref:Syntaxin-8 n=1 Tax=Pseudolycoriella hygida TaxID=35572 RepID=A0A9Q0S3U2_9DIPT|nr:Syntaxin-8 [Pseudolycoriella hygida]